MNRVLGLLVALLLASNSAFAAADCYTQAEAEAEQGIRIHSELMVIGLNCNHMGKRHGEPLYSMFREFTARHGALFSGYETTILENMKANGVKDPNAALITLRTNFANKISNDAAKTRPDIFCSQYAERIIKASAMSDAEVKKWAGTIYPSHPVSKPVCAAK